MERRNSQRTLRLLNSHNRFFHEVKKKMAKWKPDLAQKKALGSGPRMFATLAVPLIRKYGDEMKKDLYNIMYDTNYKIGQQLAKKAKDVNDLTEFERLLLQGLIEQGLNTPGFDDPARKWVVRTKNKVIQNLSLCGGCEEGVPKVWRDMGLDNDTIRMLGEIYCKPWVIGPRKGFNPKIKLKFTKWEVKGDPYCEFCEEIKA